MQKEPGVVAEQLGVDVVARACDDVDVGKAL